MHTSPGPDFETSRFEEGTNSSVAPAADFVRNLPKKSLMPICVDLDGTLVKTDTFIEQAGAFLKACPDMIYMLPLWLSMGKAHTKSMIARQVALDPSTLPYNRELLDYLEKKKEQGHPLILVTGANGRIAKSIFKYLGIFDALYASDRKINLTGKNKMRLLCHLFGEKKFIYCGNSMADLTVWGAAAASIVVEAPAAVQKKAHRLGNVQKVFGLQTVTFKAFRKALRVHQWAKNALIFLPLFLANHLQLDALWQACIAFVSFSFVASAGYVFNDLLDVASDRLHPEKGRRPFASGALPVTWAPLMFVGLMAAGGAVSLALPWLFTCIVGLYAVATLAYTLKLKRVMVADVLMLAGFYTLRLFSGGVAVSVEISSWLLAFSSFFFLSLALIKRSSELAVKVDSDEEGTISRGYLVKDHPMLRALGSAAGFISILVLAQYVTSETAANTYAQPDFLWAICVILIYWITRYWLLANRGHMDYDPVAFAIRDKVSYFVIFVIAASWLAARGF